MNADEAIPEPEENDDRMVVNSVGSFVWRVDDMNRLRRFLILGSEYATYYIGERTLGRENARAISNLLQGGRGVDVVNEILRFSTQGRTTKQDPIMFALAMCAREGDLPTKRRAYEILPQVCRIPTHLFMFVGFCETLSRPSTGWSRAHRNAMKKWYIIKARDDPMKLAMDVTKYRKREGWSHRDVARLTHLNPVAANVPDGLFAIMMYIAQGWNEAMNQFYFPENGIPPGRSATTNAVLEFLNAVEAVKQFRVDNIPQVVNLILTHNLVCEHIPTECLRSIEVGIYR
ncbi:60 kDa SS-A Ro ribonucleo [Paramuricea clavata]|uniref:60 kDa SS-A Ro ribonucleo n=1 Tax=Paramuricea clavata TaxID=317549 RepID=A0A7D9I506_PARCT|nr:60 kDa SS-A Ro ribonucleo [Paramuricea clavata]